jgi:uncharacterized protein (TIGR02246 family)
MAQHTMQDEVALRQLVRDIVSAWNKADGRAFARGFAADAEFRDVYGQKAFGRETIAQGQQRLFDTVLRGSHIEIELATLRFIRSDVVYVETLNRLRHANNPFSLTIGASIAVKENGMWQIVTCNNAGILPDASGD